jgi:hypothetical protein
VDETQRQAKLIQKLFLCVRNYYGADSEKVAETKKEYAILLAKEGHASQASAMASQAKSVLDKQSGANDRDTIYNFLAVLLILITRSMQIAHSMDPDGGGIWSGNPVCIIDSHGAEIVPPKFARIRYIGHGLFIAIDSDLTDKYLCGEHRFLFNRKGMELKPTVPARTLFRHWRECRNELPEE